MKKLLLAAFIMTSSTSLVYTKECQATQIDLSADEEMQFAASIQKMIALTDPLKSLFQNLFPAESLAQLTTVERDVVVKYLGNLDELLSKELAHEIFVSIYRKYFTLAEINVMLEFYSSEAGMKCIKLTPTVSMECLRLLTPKIEPILNELNNELSTLRHQQAEQAQEINQAPQA